MQIQTDNVEVAMIVAAMSMSGQSKNPKTFQDNYRAVREVVLEQRAYNVGNKPNQSATSDSD